jgi:hypothetical protein
MKIKTYALIASLTVTTGCSSLKEIGPGQSAVATPGQIVVDLQVQTPLTNAVTVNGPAIIFTP